MAINKISHLGFQRKKDPGAENNVTRTKDYGPRNTDWVSVKTRVTVCKLELYHTDHEKGSGYKMRNTDHKHLKKRHEVCVGRFGKYLLVG